MAADTGVAFARALRATGIDVPMSSVIAYVEALASVGLDRASSVYWAGRATLVRQPEDIPVYDELFASFWLGRTPSASAAGQERTVDVEHATDEERSDDANDHAISVAVRYSPLETLRHNRTGGVADVQFAATIGFPDDLTGACA